MLKSGWEYIHLLQWHMGAQCLWNVHQLVTIERELGKMSKV